MKKLLLIDGMAAVYRAYYALNKNPRINSKGMNTSAILGFATTLYDLLSKQLPTHVGVAFDLQKPTFRHEMYADYKANRDAMPEEIQQALPWVHKIIEAFRIPILTCEGYEADDVIGTLAHQAEAAGFDDVLMVSPDKDFAQLVTPRIRLYRYGRMGKPDQILGVQEVLEKFGISRCCQVIDLLGLWGDSSDNIPGVRGVGEKGAKKLIDQFGSIEEMVAHADDISNQKTRELIKAHAEEALFSKDLATIRLDAPIVFDEELLRLKNPDKERLKEITDYLEFRMFARRVLGTESAETTPPAPARPTLFDTPAAATAPDQPTLFDNAATPADAPSVVHSPLTSEVMHRLAHQDLAITVEGPLVVMSTNADEAYSLRVGELDIAALRTLMQDPETGKLCCGLKELKYILEELDIQLAGSIFDVQLAHYLLDAEMRHTLDFICSSMLGFVPTDAPARCAALWQLYPRMVSRLNDNGLENLYNDLELPLVDVLMDMEKTGVRIDVGELERYARTLNVEREALEQRIHALAGGPFNIASPRQLGEVLYEKLKITDKPPRTATKQYSTAEEVLQRLAEAHPIVPLILEYRSITKLVGTYLDSFPKLINPATGRLHTVYNQTVTATGRLSSSNPNLQNIPIRTERGREIRKAFVAADDDHLLLAADYSQIELRIIASLAHDEQMLHDFNTGYDIHAATAAKIYHLSIGEVSKEQRRNAKSVNFGIVYGISAFGLAQQLSIPRKEAAALIEQYFAHYPAIQNYIQKSIDFAREHGYAQTLLGRRRYLPDIVSRNAAARAFAERNAVNMPIQGTSADMIKKAMVDIYNELKRRNLRSKMILQVHDELVFDLYRPEEAEMRQLVTTAMQQALPLDGLTIEVGIDIGNNWLEAH